MNRLPRTHTNCQTNLGSDCPDNNGLSTHFHEQEPSFKTGPSDAQDNPFTSFLPWHSEKFNIVQKSTEEIRLLKEREGLAIGPQYIGEWASNLKAAWNTWDKNASDSARKIAFTRLLVGKDSAGNNWNSLLRNQSHEFLASYAELLIHFRALLDPLILKNLIEHNLSSLYRELRQGSSPFTAQIEIHALLLFFSDHPEPSEATRTAVLETLQKHARLALEGRMSDVGRWAGLKAMEKHLQQGNPLSEDEAKEECAGAMRTLLYGRQRTELRWLDNSLDGIVGWYSTHHGLASEDLAATRRAITEAMFPDAQHCQPPFEIYRAFNHPAEELFPTRRIPQKIEGPSKASLYRLPDETQALEKKLMATRQEHMLSKQGIVQWNSLLRKATQLSNEAIHRLLMDKDGNGRHWSQLLANRPEQFFAYAEMLIEHGDRLDLKKLKETLIQNVHLNNRNLIVKSAHFCQIYVHLLAWANNGNSKEFSNTEILKAALAQAQHALAQDLPDIALWKAFKDSASRLKRVEAMGRGELTQRPADLLKQADSKMIDALKEEYLTTIKDMVRGRTFNIGTPLAQAIYQITRWYAKEYHIGIDHPLAKDIISSLAEQLGSHLQVRPENEIDETPTVERVD